MPRPLPIADCAANGGGCATAGDCCSRRVRRRALRGRRLPVGGRGLRAGADCCSFVCAADPAGTGAARLRQPGRMRLRRTEPAPPRAPAARSAARGGACGGAGLRGRAGSPARRAADCCSGACMAGVCAPTPDCRPAGEPCAKSDDCCGRTCADARRERRADLPAAGCVSRRRRDLRDRRQLLQRPLLSAPGGGARCQALPGCRPALALCMDDKDCCSGRCAPSAGRTEPLRARARLPAGAGTLRDRRDVLLGRLQRRSRGRGPLREGAARDARITAGSSASCA